MCSEYQLLTSMDRVYLLSYLLPSLLKVNTVQFFFAINVITASLLIMETCLTMNPVFVYLDVPVAPAAPKVDDITATSCSLSWAPPTDDGGSPVTGYYVERKSSISPRWVRVNKSPITDLTLPISELLEGTEYEFRVIAVNKKGESSPSTPSTSFLAKNPYG